MPPGGAPDQPPGGHRWGGSPEKPIREATNRRSFTAGAPALPHESPLLAAIPRFLQPPIR